MTVVGAGMSGAACAAELVRAGVDVRVVDRGRAPGGRMASPVLQDRRVDTGAGYFTVRDNGFESIVDGWRDQGLARPWTDTFGVLALDETPSTKSGPTRWATDGGLRSLVRDVLGDIPVETAGLDRLPDGHVVVAMPDPQAVRLVDVPDAVDYEPVIAVVVGYDAPLDLPFEHAAFVNDHPDITFLADDGSRRGDGAPVLVVHTTPDRAGRHLDDPDAVIPVVVDGLRALLGVDGHAWTHAHRWTFAKPSAQHETSCHLVVDGDRVVGLAGDQWCPEGAPRVESAWRSGVDLAAALLPRL